MSREHATKWVRKSRSKYKKYERQAINRIIRRVQRSASGPEMGKENER